ncbi:MAG TPA: hypothetical protein VFQ65_04770 [Kofleriaceae bacterium]|nr:hypothetical protein [Kofleriaceae bacterium]
MIRCSILVFAAACAAHVAPSRVYAPAGVTHWSDGHPAVLVAVPPEAPHGYVELESFGVIELRPRGTNLRFTTVHVRLAITNDEDDAGWTVRPADQLLEVPGEGTSRAIYVNTDMPEATVLQIAKRDHRVVDLYYPLPATIARADQLPWFELHWQIATPARLVASTARFEPFAGSPAGAPQVIFYAGWGSHWWFDPTYPDIVFLHHRRFDRLPHGPVAVIHR